MEAGACARVAARWTCVHDRYFTGQSRGPQPREGLASTQTRRPSGGYSLPGRLQLRRSTGNRPVRSGDSHVMSGTHRDFPGVIQRREQASESNGRCMLLQSAKPASMGRFWKAVALITLCREGPFWPEGLHRARDLWGGAMRPPSLLQHTRLRGSLLTECGTLLRQSSAQAHTGRGSGVHLGRSSVGRSAASGTPAMAASLGFGFKVRLTPS